jgi:ATP-binding cassette subfamily A (ABC1) protein 3
MAPFLQTKTTAAIEQTADGIVAVFIFTIGMSFIPASIISFIVKERETNVKH